MTPDTPDPRLTAADQSILLTACSTALLTLVPVAAHQTGLLHHLPDPPAPIFASDRITGSALAHPLGIPDSLLGLASYSITFALILLARRRRPILGIPARHLLAAKLLFDATAATYNATRQLTRFRKLCSWCTATALATAAMVVAGRHTIASSARTLTGRPHPLATPALNRLP